MMTLVGTRTFTEKIGTFRMGNERQWTWSQ